MNPSPDVAAHPSRILIVDDERHNRQLLEVMLTPEGFHLATATSGEEALAMVAQQPPDLILLDVMMPGMNGYQVASKIKGDLATKNIPVVMVSALDDGDARMLGLNAGAEEFLSKPVNRAELCVRVRNLLRLKAYGDEQERSRKDQIRFKDEFLSHVSHELRSPLTAIKQFTSILLGGLAGELNKEQREYQQIVLRNIHQLQSMIDDLLEITRLETGKLGVEAESVSISDAVTDTIATLQVTARAKGITVAGDVSPSLPSAHADRLRVRQILIILLDNAIKFTAAGGTVMIRARPFEHDPQFLLLEVSDNGCGMSPEKVERIFERLYQISETTQGSRDGLGLGLFICKELVTRQGGHIWVKSQAQAGSTFSFILPIFSWHALIAPLLKNDTWPSDSLALVRVEAYMVGTLPAKDAREEWSREARSLIERCLLPDLDVLLPNMSSASEERLFFVAAFTDERGASILADRIRQQFARLAEVRRMGRALSVSYTIVPSALPDVGASPENVGASPESLVASMAAHLEDWTKSQYLLRGCLS
jgi:two-component system sensor histidine kinase/response regulator